MFVQETWAQNSWPPCDNANKTYFFTKQTTLMRSTILSLPLLLVFPGLWHFLKIFKMSSRSIKVVEHLTHNPDIKGSYPATGKVR
jgi:hypothetical protein